MNLNELARQITLREGKKKSLSIAQVKEVMKITLQELAQMNDNDILNTVQRYYVPSSGKKVSGR